MRKVFEVREEMVEALEELEEMLRLLFWLFGFVDFWGVVFCGGVVTSGLPSSLRYALACAVISRKSVVFHSRSGRCLLSLRFF